MAEVIERVNEIIEDMMEGRFLTFTLGNEIYGLEIKFVTEIIGIQAITEVPELPNYIKGIINLRGQIIPVMDMRLRFKKEERAYTDRTCIIVVEIKDLSIGLIVDTVLEVLTIEEDNVVAPPNSKTGFNNRYLNGVGKINDKVVLLLDCKKIINDDDVEDMSNATIDLE